MELDKVIVSESIICPKCGFTTKNPVVFWNENPWIVIECQNCKAKIPALTLPGSSFWAVFTEKVEE